MNQQMVNFLAALKQVVSSPAVAGIPDAGLRTQLQMADRVLGHLLVQQTTLPGVEAEMLKAFVAAVDGMDKVLAERGLPVDAVRELRALVAAGSTPTMEETLRPARDLQQQLCGIASDDARARRRELVAIETRSSTRMSEAFEASIAPPADDPAKTGAVNVRTIDEPRFNEFLAAAFPREPGVRLAGYTFVVGGHSKYTARIQLEGVKSLPRSVVLRGDGSAKYGGASVREEYRLIEVLHRNGVSVPRPLALDETGRTFGAPIMLVEEKPGEIIGHMFNLPQPNAAVSLDVATQLARLHRIPVGEFGDRVESAGRTNREKATRWLDESYASFKALNRASPIYETAFHWLRDNVGLSDGARSLVHGDYGLNNLLVHEGRVSAILDWEFAHIGNPVYDLGYFYFQAERLSSWKEFLDAYRKAGGFDATDAQLDYAILFAATRLGVMVCQTEAAFATASIKGIGAAMACTGYHDVSVMRIAGVLERVL